MSSDPLISRLASLDPAREVVPDPEDAERLLASLPAITQVSRYRNGGRRAVLVRMRSGLSAAVAVLAVLVAIAIAGVGLTVSHHNGGNRTASPSATAATGPKPLGGVAAVIKDCLTHGRLTQHFSAAQIAQALATMPVRVARYTNCQDVLGEAVKTRH